MQAMILLAGAGLVVNNRTRPREHDRPGRTPVREIEIPRDRTDGGRPDAMSTDEMTLATLRGRFERDAIAHLMVQFVDIHGSARVKLVPARALRDVIDDGAGFAGGAVWGMGQGPHAHDLMARVDPSSYTPMPHEPGVARFAADLFVDDHPHPYCPRVNLKRVLARAADRGYRFQVGVEPEFFLVVRQPDGSLAGWDPHAVDDLSKPCYDFQGLSAALPFLRTLAEGLDRLGWNVYQCDHEDANSQYEVNFRYAEALETADRLIFFRMMTGQLARRFGAIATFMAKPFATRTGSGAHLHYHLANVRDDANLFRDEADPRGLGLSSLAYAFLGGVIEHAPAICAVNSPTVNCYKRLQMGPALTGSRSGYTWTPAFITYGDNNRTQMLRVPEPGHVEDRSVSSAFNPYLGLAAYLAAGLDGIDARPRPGRAEPGEPVYGRPGDDGPPRRANAAAEPARGPALARGRRGHPRGPRPDRRRVPPAQVGRVARVPRAGRGLGGEAVPDGAVRRGRRQVVDDSGILKRQRLRPAGGLSMAYVDFDLRKAVQTFGLTESDQIDLFAHAEPIEPSESLQELLQDLVPVALGINSEQARREYIISPILLEARRRSRTKINVLPGVMLKVDEPKGLTGYCDYLISRSPKLYYLESPIVAVVEAKREDLNAGLGQCAAEMVAIKIFNERDGRPVPTVYGAVTSGTNWRVLKLEGQSLSIDLPEYVLRDLAKILGILVEIAGGGPEPVAR